MNLGDISLACATALVDGLVDGGVRARMRCRRGPVRRRSRSPSLAIRASQVHVQLDERSGAFFALGVGEGDRAPGDRGVHERHRGGRALPRGRRGLAVADAADPADRRPSASPPRDGSEPDDRAARALRAVRRSASFDLPVPVDAGQEAWWRQAAHEAIQAMATDPVGPVHLNCPFEEPLTPSVGVRARPPGRGAARRTRTPGCGPRSGRDRSADRADLGETGGDRGRRTPGAPRGESHFWSGLMGWPVLAEPTSGDRGPETALAAGQVVDRGSLVGGTSPRGRHPVRRVPDQSVDAASRGVGRPARGRGSMAPGSRPRPTGVVAAGRRSGRAARGARTTPGDAARDRHRAHGRPHGVGDRGSLARPDRSRARRVARRVERRRCPGARHDGRLRWTDGTNRSSRGSPATWRTGPRTAAGCSSGTRRRSATSTSRCVRDGTSPSWRNRGASGIDGLVSTALGISVARPGPVVALVGDLSFLHDAGAVLWNATREVDLTVVVVDNGGGHVFSLLPQRELPEHRDLFVTPHAVDIGGVCEAAGAGYQRVERASDLLPALDRAAGVGRGIRVIDVMVDAELGFAPPDGAPRRPSTPPWRVCERAAALDRVRHDRRRGRVGTAPVRALRRAGRRGRRVAEATTASASSASRSARSRRTTGGPGSPVSTTSSSARCGCTPSTGSPSPGRARDRSGT